MNNSMTEEEAVYCIESLRHGIPPANHIRHYTVGRQLEIQAFRQLLTKPEGVLLLQAGYGSGKTHLLQFLREIALEQNFAVSLITLDAKSGIQFNRLDEIFGAICRRIAIPGYHQGLAAVLDQATERPRTYVLRSPIIWAAEDFWRRFGERPAARQAIVDWLTNPRRYANRSAQQLLCSRIANTHILGTEFNNRRREGAFRWYRKSDYTDTWNALKSLNDLVQIAGTKGLIVLVDEFEDVINNMTKVQQLRSFSNLFGFYSGYFPSLVVFAVTPDFIAKCRRLLWQRAMLEYTIEDFEKLPRLEVSPLAGHELSQLGQRISATYELAYGMRYPNPSRIDEECRRILQFAAIPDRPRVAVKRVIEMLDAYLEGD